MAVDFGLLNPANSLPMKAAQSFKPVDAVGNVEAAYSLAGKMTDTQENIRKQQAAQQDREILRAAMQSGEVDFSSPTKMQQSIGRLQGKLSPDTFMQLSDHATKSVTAEAQMMSQLAKSPEERLKLAGLQLETAAPKFQQIFDAAEQVKTQRGQQAADEVVKQGMQVLITQLASARYGSAPVYDQGLLQQWSQIGDHETLKSVLAGTHYQKDLIANALHQAQTRASHARADFLEEGGGGKWQTMVSEDGKVYRHNAVSGKTLLQGEDGDWTPVATPAKLRPLGSDKSNRGVTPGSAEDFAANPITEHEKRQARQYNLTGKMPAMGTGQAASNARLRLLAAADKDLDELGLTDEQVVQARAKIKQTQEGIKRLTTQGAQIRAGEENANRVLGILEQEVKKAGGPDSPKLKSILNKVRTEWMGDPDFVGVNQAYMDLIENLARIYSGVTGAAGTPVSFLELARKSLPDNPSMAQVLKLKETVPKLFTARKEATEAELNSLVEGMKLPVGNKTKITERVDLTEADKIAGKTKWEHQYKGNMDAARADLKDVLEGIRAAKGDQRGILEEQKRAIEAAIEYGKSSAKPAVKKPTTSGWNS